MVYNISESILLKLGRMGYVFVDGYHLRPLFSWERIDAWKRCCLRPLMRVLLMPWCIKEARWLGRRIDVSPRAAILLTELAIQESVDEIELKVTYRWPVKVIRRILGELSSKGFITEGTAEGETYYRLTLDGMCLMLFGEPVNIDDRLKHIDDDRGEAHAQMVNEILLLNRKHTVPFGLWWKESGGMQDGETSSDEKPAAKDDPIPVEFFARVERVLKNYESWMGTVPGIISSIEACLSEDINESVRKGLDTIGFASLDFWEKMAVLSLARQFKAKGLEPYRLCADEENVNEGRLACSADMKRAVNSLVGRGIAVLPPKGVYAGENSNSKNQEDGYILSPDAAGALFRGRQDCLDYASMCRQTDLVRADSIEKRQLYFSSGMEREISVLDKLLDPSSYAALTQRLAGQGRKSLTFLFYGGPGTGKTELVRQLAARTGRDVMMADPAKLSGCFVGDSEKNAREIFRTFKYITKLSERAPILLFNEADGIISKRLTEVARSADKSENAVQGIILQELETFEGIFIATTNLEINLDEAMDRRFLYKVHFETPPADVRAKIIRDKMPWMNKRMAETIAEEFILSGGQIDNVACRCLIAQFTANDELSLETVRAFCSEELSISRRRSGATDRKIGFV